MTTLPGLREDIYLGGVNLSTAPDSVSIAFDVGETRQRAADGTLLAHAAKPFVGACMRPSKAKIALTFVSLTGADIDALNRVVARGGPFDFCAWTWHTESFPTAGGTLARRNAPDEVPSGYLPTDAATRYALVGTDDNGSASVVNLSAVDPHDRTPFSATGTAPIDVRYVPLFSVRVGESQPVFSESSQQGATLELEEV